jgi:hypothetical protein
VSEWALTSRAPIAPDYRQRARALAANPWPAESTADVDDRALRRRSGARERDVPSRSSNAVATSTGVVRKCAWCISRTQRPRPSRGFFLGRGVCLWPFVTGSAWSHPPTGPDGGSWPVSRQFAKANAARRGPGQNDPHLPFRTEQPWNDPGPSNHGSIA